MICRHCNADVERDDLPAHLVAEHHLRVCVLCARRGRATEVETGHCCAVCRVRLDDLLVAIVRLSGEAVYWIEPTRGEGTAGRSVPGSRPPINVEALDAERADAPVFKGQQEPPTVVVLLGLWERMIREERGMTEPTDPVVLTTVVPFLRGELDWITTTPTFPLEDFADEIEDAARPLWRWDTQAEERQPASIVECPTLRDNGQACGKRLTVRQWTVEHGQVAEPIRCPRCGVTREPAQLVNAVGIDDAYVPAGLAAEHLGIAASTIRQWAADGHVRRDGSRYRYGDIRDWQAERRTRRGAG